EGITVVSALFDVVDFLRRPIVSFSITTVVGSPEFIGIRMKIKTNGVSQSGCKNRAFPGGRIHNDNRCRFRIGFFTVITKRSNGNIALSIGTKIRCAVWVLPRGGQVFEKHSLSDSVPSGFIL